MFKPNFISDDISLIEETHTYVLKSDPNAKFTSVTTWLHHFFPAFHGEQVAKDLIRKIPKYRGRTVEDLLAEWKETSVVGTASHKEVEMYILHGTEPTYPKAIHGARWIDELNKDNEYDLYPEVILFHKGLGISGCVDLIAREKKTGKLRVYDWKFVRNLRTSSFNNEKGLHKATSHLDNCNHKIYGLQMATYRYFLEKFFGEEVIDQHIVHLHNDGATLYKTPNYSHTLTNMLADQEWNGIPKYRIGLVVGDGKLGDIGLEKLNHSLMKLPKYNLHFMINTEVNPGSLDLIQKLGFSYTDYSVQKDVCRLGKTTEHKLADFINFCSHLLIFSDGTYLCKGSQEHANKERIPNILIHLEG